MYLKRHFFSLFLFLLIVLFLGSSYLRFEVLNDYLVSYETDCDPEIDSCFIGCEDNECSEEYYYANIERRAYEIKSICGEDITECDEAYYCPDDSSIECKITYCNPELDDECSDLNNI